MWLCADDPAYAQKLFSDNTRAFSEQDSLVKKYLSDTLNAATKIRRLVKEAIQEGDSNKSKAILEYQIGLSLAPYAEDSADAISQLYAEFSGLLLDAGATNLAIEYCKKALHYRRLATHRSTTGIYHLLGRISSYYVKTRQLDSAQVYNSLALKEARQVGEYLWISSAQNNIGFLYEIKGQPDSALYYFNRAWNDLQLHNSVDSGLAGSIRDNIAVNEFRRSHFSEALALYKINEEWYRRLPRSDHKILQAQLGTFHCLLEQKNQGAAFLQLQKLKSFAVSNALWNAGSHKTDILKAFQEYYTSIGDLKSVLHYHMLITAISDSIGAAGKKNLDELIRASTENEMAKASRDIQLQKLVLAEKEHDLSNAREAARRNFIIIVVTLLFSTSILVLLMLYFRNRQRLQANEIQLQQYQKQLTEKELQNQRLIQEKVEQELHYKKGDLHDLGIYLTQLKDMHGSMTDRLFEIKNQKGDQQKDAINKLIHELDAQLNSHQRLEFIQQSIDQVNREFYAHLLKAFPDLTKSEVELCGFFKLNMSTKEISVLKGISQESVKMSRYRLRKKLNLQPEEDIYYTLSQI